GRDCAVRREAHPSGAEGLPRRKAHAESRLRLWVVATLHVQPEAHRSGGRRGPRSQGAERPEIDGTGDTIAAFGPCAMLLPDGGPPDDRIALAGRIAAWRHGRGVRGRIRACTRRR